MSECIRMKGKAHGTWNEAKKESHGILPKNGMKCSTDFEMENFTCCSSDLSGGAFLFTLFWRREHSLSRLHVSALTIA